MNTRTHMLFSQCDSDKPLKIAGLWSLRLNAGRLLRPPRPLECHCLACHSVPEPWDPAMGEEAPEGEYQPPDLSEYEPTEDRRPREMNLS